MASIAPNRGGPSTVIRELSRALVDQGVAVTVAAHNDTGSREDIHHLEKSFDPRVELQLFSLSTKLWQYSHDYMSWIRRSLSEYDFVLIHSLFLSHSSLVAHQAAKKDIPYAIRPHGSLTSNDLRKKRVLKRLLLTVDRKSLSNARFLFCTSDQEAQARLSRGLGNAVSIPLGVNDELFQPVIPDFRQRRSLLFLGRLTEKKGVDVLIRSLAEPRLRESGVSASIVGPDDDGLRHGYERLAVKLGVQDSIKFADFTDGEAKYQALRSAGVFVLPSRDENFGVAVAEALASGLPAVVSPGVSHAPAIRSARAGRVVSRDPRNLAAALSEIVEMPPAGYAELSHRARNLAHDKYRWQQTAAQFVKKVEESI